MQRMHELMNKAVVLYQKAIRVEPRLISAYNGLIQIGYMDSQRKIGEAAFEAARKIDPTCLNLIGTELIAREERWGGSYEKMRELEDTITPYIDKRPLLGLYLNWAETDRGESFCIEGSYSEAENVLRKLPDKTPYVEPYRALACAIGHQAKAADWSEIAALVEAWRFDPSDADNNYQRAKVLLQSSQREFAALVLRRAIASNPEDADLRNLLSATELN
jgi:tetratricopeptide (TPR) repeat protein